MSLFTPADATFMARALTLAAQGVYTTFPNPAVGCVLVQRGEVIGEGWHQRAGEGHAEVNALAAAQENGHAERIHGATAYVTLEPCSFTGKTGPCSQALITAGVARVVYGMQDPNPKVAGRGLQQLQNASIEVQGPLAEAQAQALNPGFIQRVQTGLPRVTLKMAMSFDGRTAMASGESQWITGPAARADVQRLRASAGAIVSGAQSVLDDGSLLTVRADSLPATVPALSLEIPRLRVVLDPSHKLSPNLPLFQSDGPIVLVHGDANPPAGTWPAHAEWLTMPMLDGRVDLRALLQELGRRQVNEVLLETGATLAGAAVAQGVVDRLVVYMAPVLMGSTARPLLQLPIEVMQQRRPLRIVDITAVGDDWRIVAEPQLSQP